MDFLKDTQYFDNSLLQWIAAVSCVVAVWFALVFLRSWLTKRLAAWASRTETIIDDVLSDAFSSTQRIFLFAVALYVASGILVVTPGTEKWIHRIFILITIFQASLWGSTAISSIVDHYATLENGINGARVTTFRAFGFLGKVAFFTFLTLWGLDNLGVDVTTLIAGLGIGGIAIALAVQNSLGDLFASLSILLDKPFVVGESIAVGDFQGSVEKIGIKTTRLRSLTGEELIFPNSDLLQSRIRNYKRMNERRGLLKLGVVYEITPELLRKIPGILKEIIDSQSGVRFERSHFATFSDSSLDFEVEYWVLSSNYKVYMDTKQAIQFAVFERFQKEGIPFAYPTRTLIQK